MLSTVIVQFTFSASAIASAPLMPMRVSVCDSQTISRVKKHFLFTAPDTSLHSPRWCERNTTCTNMHTAEVQTRDMDVSALQSISNFFRRDWTDTTVVCQAKNVASGRKMSSELTRERQHTKHRQSYTFINHTRGTIDASMLCEKC
jgi:hypothetical protein